MRRRSRPTPHLPRGGLHDVPASAGQQLDQLRVRLEGLECGDRLEHGCRFVDYALAVRGRRALGAELFAGLLPQSPFVELVPGLEELTLIRRRAGYGVASWSRSGPRYIW